MNKIDLTSKCKASTQEIENIKNDMNSFCSVLKSEENLLSISYDYAVIRLYKAFENFIFNIIVGDINQDSSQISDRFDVAFPKNLKKEICEFIVTKGNFFSLNGYGGLVNELNTYLGYGNDIYNVINKKKNKDTIMRLSALRNFAAHENSQSKKVVRTRLKIKRISSTGDWIRKQGRFEELANDVETIIKEIQATA